MKHSTNCCADLDVLPANTGTSTIDAGRAIAPCNNSSIGVINAAAYLRTSDAILPVKWRSEQNYAPSLDDVRRIALQCAAQLSAPKQTRGRFSQLARAPYYFAEPFSKPPSQLTVRSRRCRYVAGLPSILPGGE